jgi:hypothetical protein
MTAPATKRAKPSMSRRALLRRPWIAFPWIAAAPLLAACTASVGTGAPEPTDTTASAIYGGVADSDAQQNASVVALEIGSGTTFTLCSGSLVAPNVVLTARHCVSTLTATAQAQIGCDDDGNSTNGADFADDQPVADIHVYVGPSIYQNEPVSANAATIFHMAGTTLCNLDVALVVLDRSITSVPPMRVRMTSPVTTGETVRAVGFGANDQNKPIGTRFRKDGLAILAVGSTISPSETPLGSSEFELGQSTCDGDSGGPAIDETTGAIVGIVSRGESDCTLDYGHVYTSLAGFVTLFQQTFAAAGGSWIAEDGSTPMGGGDAGSGPAGDGGSMTGSSSGGASSGGSGSGSGSGGNGETGGSGAYAGGVNLHSGQGSGCSAASGGSGGDASSRAAATLVLALLGLSLARRRDRLAKAATSNAVVGSRLR